MVRISITADAFEAIRATLPKGAVVAPAPDEDGGFYIWLHPSVVDKLRAIRGPGESYSDVILLVANEFTKRD
jgi:hypothetical protein